MPAWQKRQPAVQPRITSTTARSCTASITGTTGRSTGGVREKAAKTCRRAGSRAHAGEPHAGHQRQGAKALGARRRAQRRDDLVQAVLHLADEEGVQERRERPGIGDRGAPAQHDRVVLPALRRVERHAGEVEHLQHVGVGELVREREAPEVALPHRTHGLERPQRHARGAHERGHVRPRAVGALGRRRRGVVDVGVEDLQRGIRDPDLVHVRVREHDARARSGLRRRLNSPPTYRPGRVTRARSRSTSSSALPPRE